VDRNSCRWIIHYRICKNSIFTGTENFPESKYKKVEFLDYRPHPGEMLIKENGVIKVIKRKLLFSRKNGI
jgi:hypothetical protein